MTGSAGTRGARDHTRDRQYRAVYAHTTVATAVQSPRDAALWGLQPATVYSQLVEYAVRFLSEDVWVSGVSDKGMAHNIAVQSSKAGGTTERIRVYCATKSNNRLAPVSREPKQKSKHSKHAHISCCGA